MTKTFFFTRLLDINSIFFTIKDPVVAKTLVWLERAQDSKLDTSVSNLKFTVLDSHRHLGKLKKNSGTF